MRWKPLLLFMLIILQTAPLAYAQETPPLFIEADRRVKVMDAGLIALNDTFTLRAPQGSWVVLEHFDLGMPRRFEVERHSFYILVEGEWRPLEFEEERDDPIMGASWFHLKLPTEAATVDWRAGLTIRASYLSYGWISASGNLHQALIPIYPMLLLNITAFNFTMLLPRGARLVNVSSSISITNSTLDEAWVLSHSGEAIPPLRNETAVVSYQPASGDEQILDSELIRTIRISRWSMEIEDNYIINNRGPTLNYIKMRIPKDSSNIEARDAAGPLTLSYSEKEDYKELQVFPRFSIDQGGRMSLWIRYSLPSEGRIEGGWERYTLRYRFNTPPSYVRKASLRIILPEGGSLIGSSPNPASMRPASIFSQEANFELGGVIPGESPEIVVEYNWPILFSALRLAQWLIIATGVVLPIYISRRRRAEAKPREERDKDLESYKGIYLDRIAHLAEIEELQEMFERKEVGRERYERRLGEITRRQGELLRELRRLRAKLEERDPALSKKLKAIEEDEEELKRVDLDLRALEGYLRSGRISREEFERRRRSLIRQIRQVRIRLERDVDAL